MTVRSNLSEPEWEWLLRVGRGETAFLTVEMSERLRELGLIEAALGGSILSKQGKELLTSAFAPVIRARKTAEARARNTPEARAERERQRLMAQRRER